MDKFPERAPVEALVCTSLTDAQIERVRGVSGVRVSDGAALLLKELPEALRPGQAQPPLREPTRSLHDLFANAEVVLGARRMPLDLAARAPHLRWVQMPLAGVNDTGVEALPHKVVLTTAAGINALPVAEYAFMAMMLLVKDAKRIIHSQAAGRWDRFDVGLMRGKTLAIVGFGTVGKEVARLAGPFGMKLMAVKRSVNPAEGLPSWVVTADRLDTVIKQADIVVLCVPATPATKGMIGPRQLALMRPGAVLVNVARGDVIDEAALAAALGDGRLTAAALDVFNQEPPATSSPFWTLPNVLLSAHVAGLFSGYDDAVVDLFVANLDRYMAGQPLINAVDREAGY